MTRKLFSVLLCAFALLLLMGAGEAPQEQPAAIVAEEESAADPVGEALETNPPAVQSVPRRLRPAPLTWRRILKAV